MHQSVTCVVLAKKPRRLAQPPGLGVDVMRIDIAPHLCQPHTQDGVLGYAEAASSLAACKATHESVCASKARGTQRAQLGNRAAPTMRGSGLPLLALYVGFFCGGGGAGGG